MTKLNRVNYPSLAILIICIASCYKTPEPAPTKPVDVILVGAGIMSATLGSLLQELQPNLTIEIFESLDGVAKESSEAWNNAGTGHAGYCELNYTPDNPGGTIDIGKSVKINEAFELSKQFWAYKTQKKDLIPSQFIHLVPHMSFVWGDKNVSFLKRRFAALKQNPLFAGMKYSEDPAQIKEWMPLIMEGRKPGEKVAATRAEEGNDVDFGSLTRQLVDNILKNKSTKLHLRHQVVELKRNLDFTWRVTVKDLQKKTLRSVDAKFVFVGAGGGALKLLQNSGIPEGKEFGGVPVGGQWLVTDKPDLIARHLGKVYGRASSGAPPMSVPHLDTRFIDGKQSLLFGPFATFSTKFLKNGSILDLPSSITLSNIYPMIQAAWDNIGLMQYLVGQVVQTKSQRFAALQEYMPTAKIEDWTLRNAGQRVQMIKNDADKGGILQFGTELVGSQDATLVALLGASPGASTAVEIMLSLLPKSFPKQFESSDWQRKLREMIPSFGKNLSDDPAELKKLREWENKVLGLREDIAPPKP